MPRIRQIQILCQSIADRVRWRPRCAVIDPVAGAMTGQRRRPMVVYKVQHIDRRNGLVLELVDDDGLPADPVDFELGDKQQPRTREQIPLGFIQRIIADIEKNTRETSRVELDEFKGHQPVAVRVWFKYRTDIQPTRKGVSFSGRCLPALRQAIDEAETIARTSGLLGNG